MDLPHDSLLMRSNALDRELLTLLNSHEPGEPSERVLMSLGLSMVALEHGRALRLLVAHGLFPSASALMRPQYEAVLRSVWVLWAASDIDIHKLNVQLTRESEKAASKVPNVQEMMKGVAKSAPPAAAQMLSQFKDATFGALNSFVHGGIHVINRFIDGYPPVLVDQIVRNSNALQTMAGMRCAVCSGDQTAINAVAALQPRFADCLPDPLPS